MADKPLSTRMDDNPAPPGPKRRRSDIVKIVEESIRRLGVPETVAVCMSRRLVDPLVWIEKERIMQTLVNLETNALEAMPAGGVLSLSIEGDDQRIVITIQDSGRGISPEHMDQLFVPYFTTKPAGEGTGLGLPLAYAAVKQRGGSMAVTSNADPAQGPTGTRITITLPRHCPAGQGKGKLIVHDD